VGKKKTNTTNKNTYTILDDRNEDELEIKGGAASNCFDGFHRCQVKLVVWKV
jgi:hypothetical protein